ncbi:thioredoxin-like protein 1 [Plakobranchus ocellatus]|uniref:Thioredoxin-like protein 1 n=1 Tax=Plakobranchus ocellatus TaxID=259542 RepID=A0AAV3ZMA2_9GAST|nr:thioredoxin-like protein 1 [Plakobranchus ocellatus]
MRVLLTLRLRTKFAIGPYEDLLTTMKKRKLRWCGHIKRSTTLTKIILLVTRQEKKVSGGVGSTVACESALRSAGTFLSRVRAPLPAPWPDGGPESLRSPCCGLAINEKKIINMASRIRQLQADSDLASELANAGSKLVVVDFFATWCGPCRAIAPALADLSVKYPSAVFLSVDVDQLQETAQKEGVTAMPTFILYRQRVKVDMMKGADATGLEEKIKKWYTDTDGDTGDSPVKGHMDLSFLINKAGSECLNESDDHTFEHALNPKGGYLESDCDEQLIMNLAFNQPVKLHSLKMNCTEENGPKNVKLFINQPHTLDFDAADAMEPVQMLDLQPEDLREGALIPLKYVKLQNVMSLTLFVKDNQTGAETTRIDHLSVIGSSVSATNMAEFKRLIMNLAFNQPVKLHSLKMNCTEENGPKNVKLFINQPHTLDFDAADAMEPVQMLDLQPEDLREGALIPLKYVKLQNVMSLTLFVKDNQTGAETTRIDHLSVIGSSVSATNMAEFKRERKEKATDDVWRVNRAVPSCVKELCSVVPSLYRNCT